MKVALYSGSFNPIGKHHIRIANETLKYVNKIVIMPVYKSLSGKILESGEHRLNMCRLAINENKNASNNNISVSDFEIKNKLVDSPIDIIQKYMKEVGKIDYFVVGIDTVLNFDKWIKKEEILKSSPFITFSRPNYQIPSTNDTWFMKYPHIFVDNFNDERSSTMAKKEKSIEFIEPSVLDYINRNALYA